jgi:MFS family permease
MFTALHNPDYRLFFGGAMVTNIGMWMQQVAQGWLVVSLTDSEFLVGLVAFCAMIPTLFLSLFGGVLADRLPKKQVLLTSQVISVGLIGSLAVLIHTGNIELWHLMLISAGSGIVLALTAPSFQAIVPEIVGRPNLMNAIALNSAQFNLTRIIGPTVGGLMIKFLGVAAAYYFNAASYLVFFLAMLFIRPKHVVARKQSNPEGVVRSLGVALSYVRGHAVIRPVLLLAMVQTIFLFPYGTLLPVFAKNVLGLEASGFSLLLVSAGVGALVASLMLARRRDSVQTGVRWMLRAQVGFALAATLFASSRYLPLSMLALVFIGWSLVTFMATGNTVVQALVPDEIRGRVMSVWMLVGLGFIPLGSLQAGAVASLVSPSFALTYGAAATLILSGLVLSRNRALLAAERASFIVEPVPAS